MKISVLSGGVFGWGDEHLRAVVAETVAFIRALRW